MRQLLAERNMAEVDLARVISQKYPEFKISQQSINQLVQNRVRRPRYLAQLAEEFGVDARWLLTGEGEREPREVVYPESIPASDRAGSRVHEWIERRKTTLDAVAHSARVSRQRLTHIANGKVSPTDEEAIRIAEALGCGIMELFDVLPVDDKEARRNLRLRRATAEERQLFDRLFDAAFPSTRSAPKR